MIPILLASTAYEGACTFASIDQGAWLNINFLVVLFCVLVAAAIYAISALLPSATREKLKGAARTEAFQAILSLFIIIILLGFAFTSCQAGESLTNQLSLGTYQDPMQFSQVYLSNLLFITAPEIFGQIYSASATNLLLAHILDQIVQALEIPIANFANLELNAGIDGVFFGYTGVLTTTYTSLLVVSYAVLFIFYFILALTEAFALTVLLPLSIIVRSFPFGGPRLRGAADSFLAIAVAFFFVLPLTITMNNYITNWVYCSNSAGTGTPTTVLTQDCNPYSSYIAFTQSTTKLPLNSLFTANSVFSFSGVGGGAVSVPLQFFGGTVSGAGGLISVFTSTLQGLWEIPEVITNYGYEIASFMFQSVVLIALDIAITIGFAQGLSKALGSVSGALGAGPFWGSV